MPTEFIRFHDHNRYYVLHQAFHRGVLRVLEMQYPWGTVQGRIVACHPELTGFSVVLEKGE